MRKPKVSEGQKAFVRRYRNDLHAFASKFLHIIDKDGKKVLARPNVFQTHLYDVLDMADRVIALKARQQGCTSGIKLWDFHKAYFTRFRKSTSISLNSAKTNEIHEKVRFMYDHLPERMKAGTRYDSKNALAFDRLGSKLTAISADSDNAGRSETFNFAHISEGAFMDLPRLLTSLESSVERGKLVIESTPNGTSGLGKKFYEMVQEARAGESLFYLYFSPWWVSSEYRKSLNRADYTALSWDIISRLADDIDRDTLVIVPTDEEAELITANNLDMNQILWRRAQRNKSGTYFDQEYVESLDNCFLAFEGAVYPNFSTTVHGFTDADQPDDFDYVIGSVDLGFGDPFTISIYGLKTTFNEFGVWDLWLLDEFYMTEVQRPDQIRNLRAMMAHWNPSYFIVDSSGAESIASFNSAGIPCVKSDKTAKSGHSFKQERIQDITTRMRVSRAGRPAFHVHLQRCPNAVRELQNYVYIPGTAIPMDKDDHMIDPLNYITQVMTRYELSALNLQKEQEQHEQHALRDRLASKHGVQRDHSDQICVIR